MHWVHRTLTLLAALALLGCQGGESTTTTTNDAASDETAVAPVPEPAAEPPPTVTEDLPDETATSEQPIEPNPAPPEPVKLTSTPPPVEYAPPPITADVLTFDNADPLLALVADEAGAEGFASNAFPPTLSDTDWHRDAWLVNDCLRCHETGVNKSPVIKHKGMPASLLTAKCRSCHVLIPGDDEDAIVIVQESEDEGFFEDYAFPPMLPNSTSHLNAWTIDDCMRCHEDGKIDNAPVVKHESAHLPRTLLKVKCRTCHVQIRAIESDSTGQE